MIKHLWVLLRRRGNKRDVKFRYVAGHSGEQGNDAADVSSTVALVCVIQAWEVTERYSYWLDRELR
jgi:ribonuclease HI